MTWNIKAHMSKIKQICQIRHIFPTPGIQLVRGHIFAFGGQPFFLIIIKACLQ
jgi:hypothetical protein